MALQRLRTTTAAQRKDDRSNMNRILDSLGRQLRSFVTAPVGRTRRVGIIDPRVAELADKANEATLQMQNNLIPVMQTFLSAMQEIGDAGTDIISQLPPDERGKFLEPIQELMDVPVYTLMDLIKKSGDIVLVRNQVTLENVRKRRRRREAGK